MIKKVSSSKKSKKNYRNLAIEMAKKIAKRRDRYTCQKTGKKSGQVVIHGSHILPVSKGELLAADPENIIALSASAHKLARDSWHQSPLEQDWFYKKFPGLKEKLLAKRETRPIKEWEWEEQYLKLKKQYEDMH
ncbi:MAG: hypothetical protein VKL42_01735 [Snowella sp.]|nr:hypothetical protein [Snowella sp.]